MPAVEDGPGREVPEGFALEAWKKIGREGFHLGIEARFQKERDGKAGGITPGTANAVGRCHEVACGPRFEHVAQVDDQAIRFRLSRDPRAIRIAYLEASNVSRSEGLATISAKSPWSGAFSISADGWKAIGVERFVKALVQ